MQIKNLVKSYKTDEHLVYSCQYHVIFCPKYRRPVLTEPIAKRLSQLLLTQQSVYFYEVLAQEIMPDHVHLLLSAHPKIGIYQTITKIKGYTSHILRQEFPELKSRLPTLWTRSKFISSVGTVSLDAVKRYIHNQKNV